MTAVDPVLAALLACRHPEVMRSHVERVGGGLMHVCRKCGSWGLRASHYQAIKWQRPLIVEVARKGGGK
jgi:hypothetical protein